MSTFSCSDCAKALAFATNSSSTTTLSNSPVMRLMQLVRHPWTGSDFRSMRHSSPPPTVALPGRWNILSFSEEARERINRATEYAKRVVYYGWIPFILLLGAIFSRRANRL